MTGWQYVVYRGAKLGGVVLVLCVAGLAVLGQKTRLWWALRRVPSKPIVAKYARKPRVW